MRILYIEDDIANRQLVEFIFKSRDGITLLQAEDGKSGLNLAIMEKPDLILLDISLPDMTGYEVLQKLKDTSETGHIPVIAVSGDSLPEDIQRGLDAGFTAYLTKPIRVNDMFEKIDAISL